MDSDVNGPPLWNRETIFPPINGSRADGTLDLTADLCDLNLAGCSPRPRKIRRRNALTILDDRQPPVHFRNPLDSFESASLMQSLENHAAEAATAGGGACAILCADQMPGPSPFHRQATPPKRKIPKARPKSTSPTFKQKHRLAEDISQIRLHQDLTKHVPKREILPECIIKGYRDQYQTKGGTKTTASNALVPYQPSKLLAGLTSLAKSSSLDEGCDEEVEDALSAPKRSQSLPVGATTDGMDVDSSYPVPCPVETTNSCIKIAPEA